MRVTRTVSSHASPLRVVLVACACLAASIACACRPAAENQRESQQRGQQHEQQRPTSTAASPPSAAATSGLANTQPQAAGAHTAPAAPAVPPPTPFPRTLKDALGATLTIPAKPQRIVSQTLGTDEILFAICPSSRIVGLSPLARDEAYSNVTKEARAIPAPAVGDAEQVLRLQPDIVFVASYSRAEVVEVLRTSHAPIFRFANFDRIEDIKTNVRLVGRAIGEDVAADALVADMDRRLASLVARVKPGLRPRVLSYSTDGDTAGANTLFDDVIRAAGAVNVTAEQGVDGFARVSAEKVLQWNPDVIVAGAKPGQDQVIRESLLRNAAVAATRAARDGRIVTMPLREYEAASQYVVNAAETLSAALWTRPAS
jgi:iron complex transport system substrate-binding protein